MTIDPADGGQDPPPRVTVVVTFYNQAGWVRQALDSVVVQSEPDLELVITDDGSTDGTVGRIDAWLSEQGMTAVVVTAERNRGLPAALNAAWPHVSGRYVTILNGDDWMEPDRVRVQADFLDAQAAGVGLVYSDLRVVDVDGIPTGQIIPEREAPMPEGDILLRLVRGPLVGQPAFMFRREVVDVAGMWNEELSADDFDFLLRAAAGGFEFRHLPVVAVNYRVNESSLSNSRALRLADDRIPPLRALLGRSAELDSAVLCRIRGLTLSLAREGYDRRRTRRHLLFVMRRAPTAAVAWELARNLVESALRRSERVG